MGTDTLDRMDNRTVEERFWSKVDKTDDCWVWTASLRHGGYGQFRLDGRNRRAHQVAYELEVGPIPDGLQLDHLCRNRACVNPSHLEPVTPAENSRRGLAGKLGAERMKAKTHCPQGHPYDEANTSIRRTRYGGENRKCRACGREYAQRRRDRGY